jgi:hypothetical protein
MKLELINEEEWIEEQINILKSEFESCSNINLKSKEDVEMWLDDSDLIQILTENFDYDTVLSEHIDFTNEEFSRQFNKLFKNVKSKVIDKFIEDVINI